MSETWKCFACSGEHPDDYDFCPATGTHRLSADRPPNESLPPGWRDRPTEWQGLQDTIGGLNADELLALGIARINDLPDVPSESMPALSPDFRLFALAVREHDQIAVTLSALPLDTDSQIDWRFAGPLMNRELPLVRFVVHYCVGELPELENTIRSIVNEWHGLSPTLGLESP